MRLFSLRNTVYRSHQMGRVLHKSLPSSLCADSAEHFVEIDSGTFGHFAFTVRSVRSLPFPVPLLQRHGLTTANARVRLACLLLCAVITRELAAGYHCRYLTGQSCTGPETGFLDLSLKSPSPHKDPFVLNFFAFWLKSLLSVNPTVLASSVTRYFTLRTKLQITEIQKVHK